MTIRDDVLAEYNTSGAVSSLEARDTEYKKLTDELGEADNFGKKILDSKFLDQDSLMQAIEKAKRTAEERFGEEPHIEIPLVLTVKDKELDLPLPVMPKGEHSGLIRDLFDYGYAALGKAGKNPEKQAENGFLSFHNTAETGNITRVVEALRSPPEKIAKARIGLYLIVDYTTNGNKKEAVAKEVQKTTAIPPEPVKPVSIEVVPQKAPRAELQRRNQEQKPGSYERGNGKTLDENILAYGKDHLTLTLSGLQAALAGYSPNSIRVRKDKLQTSGRLVATGKKGKEAIYRVADASLEKKENPAIKEAKTPAEPPLDKKVGQPLLIDKTEKEETVYPHPSIKIQQPPKMDVKAPEVNGDYEAKVKRVLAYLEDQGETEIPVIYRGARLSSVDETITIVNDLRSRGIVQTYGRTGRLYGLVEKSSGVPVENVVVSSIPPKNYSALTIVARHPDGTTEAKVRGELRLGQKEADTVIGELKGQGYINVDKETRMLYATKKGSDAVGS
ncbi:MAG: hypothetical protein HY513_01925 [Candidatus Aenigmarchaeota archaeon]|nr:hypothetical protein [Candidatus Aenigmarchaeota archaeon]